MPRILILGVCFVAACGGRRIIPDDGSVDGATPDGGTDAGFVDAGRDAFMPFDTGPRVDAGRDAGGVDSARPDARLSDSGPTPDAGFDVGGSDVGASDAGSGDAGAVSRGTYIYSRLPLGGLRELHVAKFHPTGDYAVVLERGSAVHVVDWATKTSTEIDLDPPGGDTIRWEDFAWDPSGDFGLLVGFRTRSGAQEGVVFRFDDAMWRATGTDPTSEEDAVRAGALFVGVEYPVSGLPMILSRPNASPWNATLRRFDPATGMFTSFITATPASAGCDDLAFVNNEFGGEGVAVVCGSSFADARYWTEIGGVPEWRPPPAATLGNTSRISSHPSETYALAIGWSGRRVHRFQDGAWEPSSSAPWFTTRGIWGVAFQDTGERALVVGRAGGSPLVGVVLEYRHDLWSMGEISDVSIPNFDSAPYLADSNTSLNDAAFRPGCDGGLIVGGRTNFSGSTGMIVEFALEGGADCDVPVVD